MELQNGLLANAVMDSRHATHCRRWQSAHDMAAAPMQGWSAQVLESLSDALQHVQDWLTSRLGR